MNYLERGNKNMVDLYVKLIRAGRKTIDDVPEKLRADVEKALEKY